MSLEGQCAMPVLSARYGLSGEALLVLPVRFQRDETGESRVSVGVGVHLGFGF